MSNPKTYTGDPNKLVRAKNKLDWENPHPLYVVWEITLQCDLACKHCGSRAGAKRPDELTTAECFDMARQMAEMGVREVTLIGGEAYLRRDWHEIAAELTRLGMVVSITTGGLGMSQQLIKTAEASGVKSISVSIDGLEETHDAQRGVKGSWKAAVKASQQIAESGMRVTTNSQINMLSMPELVAMADLLHEIGSIGWQLQLTVAMGRAADRPELLLQPYHLLELFPLLVWIKENKLDPRGIRMFPGNNLGYFGPYEERLRYGGDRGGHYSGCAAGLWTLGLESDGKIKGCPSLTTEDWTGGNIRDSTLADVVNNSPELTHLKNRTRDNLWGYCHTCYYGDICKAGCTWTSDVLLGRPGNNPYCIHRATELEKVGIRERIVKVEDAPGLPFDSGRFELVEEPFEEGDAEPSILGVNVADVLGLTTDKRTVWTADQVRETLRKRLVNNG